MGFFKALFGSSKDEVWQQVAEDIGGDFIDGGFWKGDRLSYSFGEWEFVLDTYTVSNGKTSTTYTRMRAPFVNTDGFTFRIYRKTFFSGLGKWLGMQDVVIGDPLFDEEFIIKGNDEGKLRELFIDPEVQCLIRDQPRIDFQVKDDEGLFGSRFPDGVDMLYFSCVGVVTDMSVLHGLFELFATVMSRLLAMDSAGQDAPRVELK